MVHDDSMSYHWMPGSQTRHHHKHRLPRTREAQTHGYGTDTRNKGFVGHRSSGDPISCERGCCSGTKAIRLPRYLNRPKESSPSLQVWGASNSHSEVGIGMMGRRAVREGKVGGGQSCNISRYL